ncbi:hypothetical protein AB0C52_24645 [Streptomyces sp. NPDC048717]|uniref:hypothetical protein n=1 Tax=Streptomyces sp. NPDC048717 TaxID=3154928 RepID=UPI003429CC78
MTRLPVRPLTVGSLARDLVASEGLAVSALRCYEILTALWVRAEDRGLPEADQLRTLVLRAARRLITGERQVVGPDAGLVPLSLRSDESVVRLPASLAVQGVEWPDLIQLAEKWLSTTSARGPVTVVGVRTGGAYLAPLVAARLAREGLSVTCVCVRPGDAVAPGRRRILLVDDPPLTGRTLMSLAQGLGKPGTVDVLVPVVKEDDVQPLRDAGIPVTTLPRTLWASTRRLAPGALGAYLNEDITWQDQEGPSGVGGFRAGRENSALTGWPGLRHRSPARAAFALVTPSGGRQQVVASWVPPGIFGDAARTAATELDGPVPPATVGVAPAMVISEELDAAARPAEGMELWLDEAVDYVLDRSARLPIAVTLGVPAPAPAALKRLASALTNGRPGTVLPRLQRWMASMGSSVPDGRCEAEKWFIDPAGRLRKTGHLTHAYRRDNELFTPLIDLAALTIAFGCDLKTVAAAVDRRLPGGASCLPALATALLCYGPARGEQLPRTYNPERAADTAREAYRLQSAMSEAALILQETLTLTPNGPRTVLRRWTGAPGALLQPVLPFGGRPAPRAPRGGAGITEDAIVQWAQGRFEVVRTSDALLLAPLGPAATWPDTAAALADLAVRLPHPDLLAWCGVPLLQMERTC